jgi:hypothetical protein
MKKKLFAIALLALVGVVHAQSTAAKKELVAKVLQLQRAAVEQTGQALVERPAAQLMQQAGVALQARVAADKRDAVAKDIQADVKKYIDEAGPLVRDRAVKLAPSTVGAVLDEKFSEDELKQLIAIMESPVNRKFLQLGGEMEKALAEKVVADTQAVIQPKVKALELSMTKRLGLPVANASTASPAAKAASK